MAVICSAVTTPFSMCTCQGIYLSGELAKHSAVQQYQLSFSKAKGLGRILSARPIDNLEEGAALTHSRRGQGATVQMTVNRTGHVQGRWTRCQTRQCAGQCPLSRVIHTSQKCNMLLFTMSWPKGITEQLPQYSVAMPSVVAPRQAQMVGK